MRPQTSATNQFAESAPIAAVEYLQAALTLAGSHDLGMAIAELDLPDRPACGIDFTSLYTDCYGVLCRKDVGCNWESCALSF